MARLDVGCLVVTLSLLVPPSGCRRKATGPATDAWPVVLRAAGEQQRPFVDVRGLAADESGAIFLAGNWRGTLSTKAGVFASSESAPFAAKISSAGEIVWLTRLGRGSVGARSIAVGRHGDVVVAGLLFPDPPDPARSTSMTVQKLDAATGKPLWAAPVFDGGAADVVAVAPSGEIALGGRQPARGPVPDPAKHQMRTRDFDVFAAVMTSGGSLLWKRVLGGPADAVSVDEWRALGKATATVEDVAVLDGGRLVLAGCTTGFTSPGVSLGSGGFAVAYSAGGKLRWSRGFPGGCDVWLASAGDGVAMIHRKETGGLPRDRDARHEVARLDVAGAPLWVRDVPARNDWIAAGLVELADGSLVIPVGGPSPKGEWETELIGFDQRGAPLGAASAGSPALILQSVAAAGRALALGFSDGRPPLPDGAMHFTTVVPSFRSPETRN